MRRMIRRITLLAAALMIVAVPALADEGAADRMLDQGQQVDRNECLLASINCPTQVDSLQQRIDRIRGEIARGQDVYTRDELRKLDRELEEAVRMLEMETVGG